MLNYQIIEGKGIVVVEPVSALSTEDFQKLGAEVVKYLAEHKVIRGLLIHARNYPGWDNFAGLITHLQFVRDHHKQIQRVAIVTDSRFGKLVYALAKHFVVAEVRDFPYDKFDDAMFWLEGDAAWPNLSVPCEVDACFPVH
jgi:hypothetical protein